MKLTPEQRRVRKLYTNTINALGQPCAYLRIGNQGFSLMPCENRASAKWFRDMLAKALCNLIAAECKQVIVKPERGCGSCVHRGDRKRPKLFHCELLNEGRKGRDVHGWTCYRWNGSTEVTK